MRFPCVRCVRPAKKNKAHEYQVVEKRTHELFKNKISALGLPLKVDAHENSLIIYPSLAFFESITTPAADPEYIKIVDHKRDYPDIANFVKLNNELQIENVKVQVIVNSPFYTIQHSIMVTWLFTEFINRMGLEYYRPKDFAHPVWASTTCIASGCYEEYITEQSRDQCIMTIDMAKASSDNIYAYIKRT